MNKKFVQCEYAYECHHYEIQKFQKKIVIPKTRSKVNHDRLNVNICRSLNVYKKN